MNYNWFIHLPAGKTVYQDTLELVCVSYVQLTKWIKVITSIYGSYDNSYII